MGGRGGIDFYQKNSWCFGPFYFYQFSILKAPLIFPWKVFLRRENSNRYAKVGIIAIADVELHEALNFKAVKRNNHYTRLIFKSSQKKIVKKQYFWNNAIFVLIVTLMEMKSI